MAEKKITSFKEIEIARKRYYQKQFKKISQLVPLAIVVRRAETSLSCAYTFVNGDINKLSIKKCEAIFAAFIELKQEFEKIIDETVEYLA